MANITQITAPINGVSTTYDIRDAALVSLAVSAGDVGKFVKLGSVGTYVLESAGGTYTLPTASTTTLGGIKVGTGLTISGGVLSATVSSQYTLPTATANVLGGVKVGSGLTITSGVLAADVDATEIAASAVSSHNGASDAHSTLFAGKANFSELPMDITISEIIYSDVFDDATDADTIYRGQCLYDDYGETAWVFNTPYLYPAQITDPHQVMIRGSTLYSRVKSGTTWTAWEQTGELVFRKKSSITSDYEQSTQYYPSIKAVVDYVARKQDALVATSVTIPSSSWANSAASVFISGITATNLVQVTPDPTSYSNWIANGVYCNDQATDQLSFVAATTPTVALTANVVIWGV